MTTETESMPAECPVFLRTFCAPEVKLIDTKQRTVTHLITTSSIDRMGDIVEAGGAQVANFMRNPVVMADHDYRIERIIGRAEKIQIESDGIMATTRFHDEGLGAMAFNLVKAGMARAWSIGFRPQKAESIESEPGTRSGFRFKIWELLEYSLVAVPANPDVVSNAIAKGLLTAEGALILFRSDPVQPVPSPSPEARHDANVRKAEPRPSSRQYDALLDAKRKSRRLLAANEINGRTRR